MRKIFLLVILTTVCAFCAASVISNEKSKKCGGSIEQCYERRLHPTINRASKVSEKQEVEASSSYWLNNAKNFVKDQASRKRNTKVAKNIIFFLGDGMSVPTTSAARMLLGGEEKQLSFEKFPYIGLSKTYCLDRMVSDSACTATAYLCGVKANYGTIGVNGRVPRRDCKLTTDETMFTSSIAKWAQDVGKATGIVTTTRITHASPAGNFAHVADRGWESDSNLPSACPKGIDIANQLINGEVGKNFSVIFGGGRREFLNSTVRDEENRPGVRQDGRNLIKEWLDHGSKRKYVYNREGLLNIDINATDAVLGLFQDTHMLYHLEAEFNGVQDEKPRLKEMTQKAIEIAQKNQNGFYLFIEGGKIDLAHHGVYAKIALDETIEFSEAIETALNMTSEEDTLIVVTADHAHTMSYAGYPHRGNDIFGAAEISKIDNIPYLTLTYANGDGFPKHMDTVTNTRLPVTAGDAENYRQKFPSTIPIDTETHGGEDVAVYATGPWAHLFTGTYEQSLIPHLMAYAACIGNGRKACDNP